MARQAETSDEDLSAAFSKLEGYAARFALVLHCVRVVDQDPTLTDLNAIDEISIGMGVELVRWFASETERVYAAFRSTDQDRILDRDAAWIERQGGTVTVRAFHRANQVRFKGAEDARKALNALAEAGYGAFGIGQTRGRPTESFRLNTSSDSDKSPIGDSENGTYVTVTCVSDAPETHEHPSGVGDAQE